MYAIIETGGKQYRVEKGDIIEIERQGEEECKELIFNQVLLVAEDNNIKIGQPYVSGAKVSAEVVKNIKGRKVVSYKYRRRKDSHWEKGHRQLLRRIRIQEIVDSVVA
ncbi:MAG: 50S ribosomal protein L21 [Candidatus Omnitrophota bacterium]